jgi:hypothetical protein
MDIFDETYNTKYFHNIKGIYLLEYDINGNDKVLYTSTGNPILFPKYIMYLKANSCEVKLKYLIFVCAIIVKYALINLVYLIVSFNRVYHSNHPLYCGEPPLYYRYDHSFIEYNKECYLFTPELTKANIYRGYF